MKEELYFDDFEADDFRSLEFDYWAKVFNDFPQEVISDEFYNRNKILLEQISDDFSNLNQSTDGKFGPNMGKKVLEIVFSNIQKFGYR